MRIVIEVPDPKYADLQDYVEIFVDIIKWYGCDEARLVGYELDADK